MGQDAADRPAKSTAKRSSQPEAVEPQQEQSAPAPAPAPASASAPSDDKPRDQHKLKEELRSLASRLAATETVLNEHAAVLHATTTAVNGHAERLEMFRRGQLYIDRTMEKGQKDNREKIEALSKDLTEVQPRVDELVDGVRGDLTAAVADLHSRAVVRSVEDASALSALKQTLRSELSEVQAALRESFARDLAALEVRAAEACERQIEAATSRLASELREAVTRTGADCRAATEALREESVQGQRGVEERAYEALARAETALHGKLKESVDAQDAQRRNVEVKLRNCCTDVSKLEETHRGHAEEAKKTKVELQESHQTSNEEHRRRMQDLDGRLQELRTLCAGVDSIPTKVAEWEIRSALERFQALQDAAGAPGAAADPASRMLSPKFNAGGICGLQLEIRHHRLEPQSAEANELRPGDCTVLLWVPAKVQLTFKLSLGSESSLLTNDFDGEKPCGVSGLCIFAEQVDPQRGSVVASLEIHEANAHAETADVVPAEGLDSQVTRASPSNGAVICRRHLNNRLPELIQQHIRSMSEQVSRQMSAIKSKAVRRVQWRLEQAFRLREAFAQGRPVCSTAFQAAGINGLQLVFYPSGCEGAKEGFCSFFLSCPAGCTLKCWLWAGRWRKEARAEPNDRVSALGRANFCRFESCVDPVDESVELALEIEEAQQAHHAAPPTSIQQVSQSPGASAVAMQTAASGGCAGAAGRSPRGGLGGDTLPPVHREDHVLTTLKLGKASNDAMVQQLPSVSISEGGSMDATLRTPSRGLDSSGGFSMHSAPGGTGRHGGHAHTSPMRRGPARGHGGAGNRTARF
eukprot:TRINITY_DN17503_c0_g1_i1.p1 TRINITY_DN17503_c0_g1~~TRINITY_DN17503_c0_g1_i1.p1  ORF type:complete len:812 (+),score=194.07 TRINITY_DN17503_c0_g1_i1:196-2631(+)